MSKPSPDSQSSSDTPRPSAAAFMVGTIADTTWRMFIPSIGGTILGGLADRALGTGPWLLIVGIAIGFGLAGLLVWRQLTTPPSTNTKDSKRH